MLDGTLAIGDQVGGRVAEAQAQMLPLDVRGLVFEAGGKRLIDGIDLRLTDGEITVIMGPNGAGKSLLLRLIHGLLTPIYGEILWGGEKISEKMRIRQAMMFQRPVLLRRSVAANVDFVLGLRGRLSGQRCEDILEHVGLADRASQPARLLSGGEQQRLALARSLALEPEVLFLDEPTASLDPASALLIEQLVQVEHERGTKIILVTHDIGQAKRLAGEVVFLHRGHVLEHSGADKFFADPQSSQARDYLAGRIVV